MPTYFESVTNTRAYRLGRFILLSLAALYALLIAVNGMSYRGVGVGLIPFTLQFLKADLFDMVSSESYLLFGYGLGVGDHPTRYALICEETGKASEAENADGERRVRGQLVDNKSGAAYNSMIAAMHRGDSQPVFILSEYAPGGAKFCAANQYRLQECSCRGRYKATERTRIPARELFSPPKPLD
jgi:hypothetical protein